MAEPRNPNDLPPDSKTHRPGESPGATNDPNTIQAPDLGGSFEENAQVRRHDGLGAGPGMEVLDEALRAAREAERNSSSGS